MSERQGEKKQIYCSTENKRSLWCYFGELYLNDLSARDDDGRYCALCEQRYAKATATSTLKRHLLNNHQIDLKSKLSDNSISVKLKKKLYF